MGRQPLWTSGMAPPGVRVRRLAAPSRLARRRACHGLALIDGAGARSRHCHPSCGPPPLTLAQPHLQARDAAGAAQAVRPHRPLASRIAATRLRSSPFDAPARAWPGCCSPAQRTPCAACGRKPRASWPTSRTRSSRPNRRDARGRRRSRNMRTRSPMDADWPSANVNLGNLQLTPGPHRRRHRCVSACPRCSIAQLHRQPTLNLADTYRQAGRDT
jgi:hypothetical protein